MVERDEFKRAISDARHDVVTSAITTSAGIALGATPALATAVVASAPILKLAHRLFASAVDRRQDRASQALEQAAAILDVGLEILEERVSGHDVRLELLARVLEAAAKTPLDQKISALASVLAYGLDGEEPPSDALIIAAALADMEAPHIVVLRHIATVKVIQDDLRQDGRQSIRRWTVKQIGDAIPELSDVMYGLVGLLARHGLVRDLGGGTYPGTIGPSVWRATALGQRCLFLLGEDTAERDST